MDTQVSLAPTHVSPLVRWLVRDTFEFPLPLNISVFIQSVFLRNVPDLRIFASLLGLQAF